MGDDFVKTEKLVEKYLNSVEKRINYALDGFKKEGVFTKRFAESFSKKAVERVKQTCEQYESRHKLNSTVLTGSVSGLSSSSQCSSGTTKRKPVSIENKRLKKQKLDKPTSSDDKMLVKPVKKPVTVVTSNKRAEFLVPKDWPEAVVSNSDGSTLSAVSSLSQNVGEASSVAHRNIEQAHLMEQLERANYVFIIVPERLIQTQQSQREMFRQICDRLNVNVSSDQIEHVYREDNALIVKFRDIKIKEMIMDSADGKKIWLDQIVKGEISWRVHIRQYMTRYYSKLYQAAQEYRETRSIHSFKFTENGLLVKHKENSKGKIVLSLSELNEYVNGISGKNGIRERYAAVSSSLSNHQQQQNAALRMQT